MDASHCPDLAARWVETFLGLVQQHEYAGPLKEAALQERLGDWTKQLTGVVVQSSRGLGWSAAAKGFALDLLPQVGEEYLGVDVMAFEVPHEAAGGRWTFPVAVFELENSR